MINEHFKLLIPSITLMWDLSTRAHLLYYFLLIHFLPIFSCICYFYIFIFTHIMCEIKYKISYLYKRVSKAPLWILIHYYTGRYRSFHLYIDQWPAEFQESKLLTFHGYYYYYLFSSFQPSWSVLVLLPWRKYQDCGSYKDLLIIEITALILLLPTSVWGRSIMTKR